MVQDLLDSGNTFDWLFVAMARHRIGKDDGPEWYARAVAWMDEHKPDDAELKRFRAEAEGVLGVDVK